MLRMVLCLCLVVTVSTQKATREGGRGGGGEPGLRTITSLLPLVQQELSVAQLQQQPRVQQLLTFHQRQQARRLRDEARRRQEQRRQQELERQRQLALRQEELERQRQSALQQQELERQRQSALRQEELERQRQSALRQEELERQRQSALRQEELERQRQLALRQEELERQRQSALQQQQVVGPYIPILEDRREGPFQDGTYYFTYTTGDGIQREERGTPTGSNTLEVTGYYSYTAPNGEVITMEYIANEYGYRAFPVRSDRFTNTNNLLRPLPILEDSSGPRQFGASPPVKRTSRSDLTSHETSPSGRE